MTPEDIKAILEDARNAGVPEEELAGMKKRWPQASDRDPVVSSTVDAKVQKAREAGASEEDIARVLDKNPQARERNNVAPAVNPSGYQLPETMDWVPHGSEFEEDVAPSPEALLKEELALLQEVDVSGERVKPNLDVMLPEVEAVSQRVQTLSDDTEEVWNYGKPEAPHFETRANNGGIFPHIANEGGSISTHRMAAEVDEDTGKWYVFPTIVQNGDGSLTTFEDSREAMRHNMRTGNIKEMPSKEEALEYAQGGYKKGTYMEEEEKTLVDGLHRNLLTPPTHTDTTNLSEVTVKAKRNTTTPHPPVLPAETPDEALTPVEPRKSGFYTKKAEERAAFQAIIPPMSVDPEEGYAGSVDFWTSAGWMIKEDGLSHTLAALYEQTVHDWGTPETELVLAARDELMYGVSEEYEAVVMTQPTLEAAQRMADRVRNSNFRNAMRENEGIMQSIGAGFVGIVADPANFGPGLVAGSAAKFIAKTAAWQAVNASGKHGIKKKIATWGAMGGTEELIRLYPKYLSNPTYKMDQYITEAAMGAGFGALMPAVIPAFRGVGKGTAKAFKETGRFGEALGVDQAFRSAVNTASIMVEQTGKGKGIIGKVKEISPGQAYKEGAEQARKSIDSKIRELRDYDVGPAIHTAVDTLDDGAAREVGVSLFRKVAQAIDSRTGGTLATKIDEIAAKLAEVPEPKATPDPDAPRKPGDADQGPTRSPEPNIQDTAKQARRNVREASEAAYKLLDEADLPPEAKARLHQVIAAARQQAEDGIETAMRKNGVGGKRSTLNNRDHTNAVVNALGNVRGAVRKGFAHIGSTIKDLPMLNMAKRGNAAMSAALRAAGVQVGAGESVTAALERALKGMSHKQRANFTNKFTAAWVNNIRKMREQLDADPRLDQKQLKQLLSELDEAERMVREQIELANVLARNPYEDALIVKAEWAQIAEEWRKQGDMAELGRQFQESTAQSAVKHQFGRLTESLSSRLIKSGGPMAQWFTYNILETPSGFGGKVKRHELGAAVYSETLDNRSRKPVLDTWMSTVREFGNEQGWSMWEKTVLPAGGNAKTHPKIQKFSEEVQLEIDARRLNVSRDSSPAVKRMADQLEQSYADLHDLQNGHVAGITDGNKLKHYQHQVWNDQKVLSLLGDDVGRKGLVDLITQAIIRGVPDAKQIPGMTPGKGKGIDPSEARVLAKALVEQKAAAAARPAMNSPEIGSELVEGMMPDLEDILKKATGSDREAILKIANALNEGLTGGTPGYAKTRVPLDLSATAMIGGREVRMIELMDNDVPAIFMRYSKEATARTAISQSTGGRLNSDKAMSEMLMAMQLEAQELGINVDSVGAKNALMMMMGRQYDGQLPIDVRRARDAISLAGMGGLGESQLAEFGLAVNRGMAGLIGVMQKGSSAAGTVRRWRGLELTPEQANNKVFLSELQEISGLFQDLYKIDRRNVHFDMKDSEAGGIGKIIDAGTGGKWRPYMQHLQSRLTGYGVIRQFEDQIAMASVTQDIAKFFDGRSFSSKERLIDLGVPVEPDSWLAKRLADAPRNKNGHIETLNLQEWSQIDKDRFGVILNRYASQQIQKGFVGEMSPEMMNPWVSFMMQFKSYPMLAAEKQQARHLKFADKEAAMGMLLNNASSGAARIVRYHSMAAAIPEHEREAYLEQKFANFGHDTLMYTGGVGMLVNNYDMAKDIGGGGSVADQLPALNYADSYIKALGGPLDGDISQRDVRNAQVAAPLGTIAHFNILVGIIRAMMDEDEE